VRKRAHYYTKTYCKCIVQAGGKLGPYEDIYEEIEAEGFAIYCRAIHFYHSEKASFSTFLYRRLSGYLLEYCKTKLENEGLDSRLEDFKKDLFIENSSFDMFSAKNYNITKDQFLQYAKNYLSIDAYIILLWTLGRQWENVECREVYKINVRWLFCGVKKWSADRFHKAWMEIGDFWHSGLLANLPL
jgi:hypothetical protein